MDRETAARERVQLEQELRASLQLSTEQESPYRQALAHYELGWLYRRRAEQSAPESRESRSLAGEQFLAAAALFAQLQARFDLHRTQEALAELDEEPLRNP